MNLNFFAGHLRAMKRNRAVLALTLFCLTVAFAQTQDPYLANNRPPDDRFKADILVVVAHPDDEGMAAAYVARAIDQGKRVAIVWTTNGDGGQNEVGPEQGPAMGDIREVEGMQAAASLGVKLMWNLGGPDTPTQNPLNSLATCDHARCLERIVRLVRLTRPEVILTWIPAPVTGENHGDHQAAAIMATEAFDMAGDPTAFPEQVTPASEPGENANHLAGLRPWQPQKLYFFSNAADNGFLDGHGPSYDATDVSPTRHMTYGEIAARAFAIQETQGGRAVREQLDRRAQGPVQRPLPFMKPTEFLLGKSLVSAAITDDVLAGTDPAGVPFQPSPGYQPMPVTEPDAARRRRLELLPRILARPRTGRICRPRPHRVNRRRRRSFLAAAHHRESHRPLPSTSRSPSIRTPIFSSRRLRRLPFFRIVARSLACARRLRRSLPRDGSSSR